ncbi:hypothetical protein EX30DRAFT_371903 [Ascodesmis nigricans]|uniref:Uncharacterized protein n=1 Tax=Ascodesmis nigricans TaxID=341454 RepID=A0A4S2MWG6_9PEZI|nr:hypothetical protein EX30DRAFT_371903 [Ascodesmis nigricans]
MDPFLPFLGPCLSTISTLTKLSILCCSLSAVESEIQAYTLLLTHHKSTLTSIISQLPQKQHLLDPGFRAYIERTLQDAALSMSLIDSVLGEMVRRIEKKGRVSWRQRFGWVFAETEAAMALEKFMSGVHVSCVGIDTRLGALGERTVEVERRVVVERVVERVVEKPVERGRKKEEKKKEREKEKKRKVEDTHGKEKQKKQSPSTTTSTMTSHPQKVRLQERKLGPGESLAVWLAGGMPEKHQKSTSSHRCPSGSHPPTTTAAKKATCKDRPSDNTRARTRSRARAHFSTNPQQPPPSPRPPHQKRRASDTAIVTAKAEKDRKDKPKPIITRITELPTPSPSPNIAQKQTPPQAHTAGASEPNLLAFLVTQVWPASSSASEKEKEKEAAAEGKHHQAPPISFTASGAGKGGRKKKV